MADTSDIREHMEVIGADGVHVGTVDRVEGDRIKLTKADSGMGRHQGHHHYLSTGLVAGVEGDKVRLSATAANAFMFEEEKDEGSARLVQDGSQERGTGGQERGTGSRGNQQSYSAGVQKNPPFRRDQMDSSEGGSHRSKSSGPSWGKIGLGAAAIATAAAAGAALLGGNKQSSSNDKQRSKSDSDRDFDLQLQTDENMRLISSAKVEGTPVYGRDGERLGKIENFMVDKYTGRVGYAVLSFGGTLGFGESLFPLPWSALTYDEDKDGYVLGITKDQLNDAPKFKKSDEPEFSGDYRRVIFRAYSRSYY